MQQKSDGRWRLEATLSFVGTLVCSFVERLSAYTIIGQTGRWEWKSGKNSVEWATSRQCGSLPIPRREVVGVHQKPPANNGGGARPCRQAWMQALK
jgi:hypothetical protein